MRRAKISELRDRLSRYLDHVRAGGTVIVLDRNRPFAEIRPLPSGGTGDEAGWVEELERTGLARRGTGRLPRGFLEEIRRRGPVAPRARLVEAILEEREEGA